MLPCWYPWTLVPLDDCVLSQEKLTSAQEVWKIWCYLMTLQKNVSQENSKISYCAGNQLYGVSWIISKFGIHISNMCGHVTWEIKPDSQEVREGPKIPFFVLFEGLASHLLPITTASGTDVEHYVTCINALANFCNDLCWSFHGIRYAENGQN